MSSLISQAGKVFGIFIVVISFLCVVQSAHAATLSLNPSSSTVTLGDEFDMVVRIDTQGESVTSADVVLTYDRNLLQVVSISKGLSGSNAFFPDFFQSLNSGQIYMGGTVLLPTDTRIGQGIFSTVRFRTLALGNATVGFICQLGATNDTNITRADNNATDIVSCSALKNIFYAVSQTPPQVQSIQINTQTHTMKIGEKSVGLSALAYDQNNLPIWTGVTYEWGMSSGNSIGTLSPTVGNITNFIPLNPGAGDIFVTARLGTQNFTAGTQMTVTIDRLGDLNDDGTVNLSDLSTLLSNFGKTNRTKLQGDINGDQNVTLADLTILLSNFGKGQSGTTSIPALSCTRFNVALNADQVNAEGGTQVVSTATGNGTLTLNTQTNTLSYNITRSTIAPYPYPLTSPETSSHIHGPAGVGETAGILHNLPISEIKVGTWSNLTDAQEQQVLNGQTYINIHTSNYPNGEIRGQIQGGVPVNCQ